MRLRDIAAINPRVDGLGRDAAGDTISFLPLDKIWADARFDPSDVIEFSGEVASYNPVAEGDILLPKVSPTFAHGRVAIAKGLVGERALATSEVFVIRPTDHEAGRFLAYRLQARDFIDEGIASWTGVAGLKRISADYLRGVHIASEVWDARSSIADFLDRECDRIAAAIGRLTHAADAVSELLERVRDEAIWSDTSVRSLRHALADACVGIVVQPARLYADDGTVPVVRAVDLADGGISIDSLVKISVEDHLRNRRSELRGGDVIVVRTGRAGRAVVVPNSLDGANCVDLLVLQPSPLILPEYLCELLNSARCRSLVHQHLVGSIQGHLNLGAILALPLPMVDARDQRSCIARISETRKRCDPLTSALETTLARLSEYRDALITEAVTGQLDVEKVSDAQMDERLHGAAEQRVASTGTSTPAAR